MEIVLKRRFKGLKYTIGSLFINDEYFCDTIEDIDRYLDSSMSLEDIKNIKVYGETAIPYGTYKIDMNTISPKFKDRIWAKPYGGKLPRLLNVKGFDGVLIHVGNNEQDTLGCLIVGENKLKGKVINSTITFDTTKKNLFNITFNNLMDRLLESHIAGEEIHITIK